MVMVRITMPAVIIMVMVGIVAPDIPARDLWVSPRHALLLHGVFVPAGLLVNGQTILQAEAVDQVDYFHLEFEAHEVILAEGTPAESYVEYSNRHGFHNAHEFAALLASAVVAAGHDEGHPSEQRFSKSLIEHAAMPSSPNRGSPSRW